MSRRQLLLRLLFKAALVRKDRALTALISVAVVATIATTTLTLYSNLEGTLSREFRGFGANVIATKHDGSINSGDLAAIESVTKEKFDVVPIAYAVATTPNGSRIVAGGADIQSLASLNSWWSIKKIDDNGSALIGSRVAEQLSPDGKPFTISFGSKSLEIHPKLVFNSGSDDDSRIYVESQQFSAATGIVPNTALVRVEGRPYEVEAAIAKLRSSAPDLEVQPIRQITQAQAAVVGKTRSVVLSASAVVLVLIMLCMIATFTSSVLERRKDFAVMKALGASNGMVNFLFAAEAALLAFVGAITGYIAGCGIAFWIGKANFDAAILPEPVLLLPVLLGSVLLALIASTAPLRLLQQIQPAGILRGE